VGPYVGGEATRKSWAWDNFYQSVLDRGEGLDKVISVVEHLLDSFDDNNAENIFMDVLDDKCYVSNGEIFSHLHDYIAQAEDSAGIPKEDLEARMRYELNTVSNILRCLKRIKNNEPTYLLPNEDRRSTQDFIERLRFAPSRMDYS